MLVRANSGSGGSGGGGNNALIFCDMYENSTSRSLGFYDSNYFDFVSGSQRTDYSENTNIKLKFKTSGKVSLFFNNQSNYAAGCVVSIGGTSIPATNTSWKTDISVASGDNLEVILYAYYPGVMILFNPDMSVYVGNISYNS